MLLITQCLEAAGCWALGLGKAHWCLETQSKTCFYPTAGMFGSLVYVHLTEGGK